MGDSSKKTKKTEWEPEDARVLQALEDHPEWSLSRLALGSGVSMEGLRRSMRRLIMRQPGEDPRKKL